MSARHLAPAPAPAAEADSGPAPEWVGDRIVLHRRVTIAELAHLWSTTTSQIDRLVRLGMPAIDLSCPRPGRRRKHLWRLEPAECGAWLRERGR